MRLCVCLKKVFHGLNIDLRWNFVPSKDGHWFACEYYSWNFDMYIHKPLVRQWWLRPFILPFSFQCCTCSDRKYTYLDSIVVLRWPPLVGMASIVDTVKVDKHQVRTMLHYEAIHVYSSQGSKAGKSGNEARHKVILKSNKTRPKRSSLQWKFQRSINSVQQSLPVQTSSAFLPYLGS